MSVIPKTVLIVVLSCVLIAVGSTAVAGQSINEPDSWGEPVIDSLSSEPPNDLKNASINYDENNGLLQFRINFTDSAPSNPLANNITQIYIDTGTSDGITKSTYTDGGTTKKFYDNLGSLDANERISVGDDTNVVVPWDESRTQFDGTKSDNVKIETYSDYALLELSEDAIGSPDEIDYKFVYIDTRNGIKNEEDYKWAPDQDSLRFSLEGDNSGETIPVGTINATINISNTPASDNTDVDFILSDGTEGTEPLNGSNNVSRTFTVNSDDFNGDDDGISATIDGENYTLDKEVSNIDVREGSTTNITFDPHELINISGEISPLSGKSGTYNVELQDNDGDTIGEPIVTSFSESGSEDYNFTGINASEFTSGGEVVASLETDADPNTIENDSTTIFSTTRYNPSDKTIDFTVNSPDQNITLETNISTANEFNTSRFNLTVNASATGDDRIDSIKHVVNYDPDQVSAIDYQALVGNNNKTDVKIRRAEGEFDITITNTSGNPIVAAGSSNVPIYNLTFGFEDDDSFEPLQSDSSNSDNSIKVVVGTVKSADLKVEGARIRNSSRDKDLPFTTNSDNVNVYNTETIIDPFDTDVIHLTEGGDMVGAPIKFDIPADAVTSNDGKINRLVLRNNQTGTVVDTIDCEAAASCGGNLEDSSPSESTFVDNGTYENKNIYNITAVPEGDGSNITVENPRGPGEEIYKRADVIAEGESGINNDTGNVTLEGDVDSVLDLRGRPAEGGLPWTDTEEPEVPAKHDVNNDGVIDIVDVTIVADEYSPLS